ncbi:neutrophil cytosol factor 2 isoform X1 [Synchiropus splendidus]|uniref:neutrophil cytosol factor 2 isoform X1 n=1 Tax=Synchiropus splendidus TaxID=270530 RepID=UPI00237DA785|nr:neutrophil cytosol factor 2 isoform X1 [Synchiropus splendidus]
MSFVDTLRQWDEAVTCVEKGDSAEALRIFLSIEEPNSKICFDIGCLHVLDEDLDKAEKAFDCSISKDGHLAVAFFQRGNTFYKKKRYEESLADFKQAFKALRGNQLIDYKALGLRYKLYACEVLHNMALAEVQMGLWEQAQENLVKALDYKTESKLNLIDKALQSTLKQNIFKLVDFPPKVLFTPNKNYVAELEKKDYLGKAKGAEPRASSDYCVVASVIPQDEFSGFAPLQPQVEDGPTHPKEPEVLRALEGAPHTVLYEFVPETSDELAVVPGNIVFVLQKGSDNWASVVFNERRGLVPYNYLEPLDILDSKKKKQGASRSPSQEPPTRPERKQGTKVEKETSKRDAPVKRTAVSHTPVKPAENTCIVKVYYTFNFAVSVTPGSSYSSLMEVISKKLNVSSSTLTLSSNAELNQESEINGDTEMESVWSRAGSGRVALWCFNTKNSDSIKPESEISLVALHSYESSSPEDLTFQQGDTIMLLCRVNQDWLEGQCHGQTGIFPASFVEEVSKNGQVE